MLISFAILCAFDWNLPLQFEGMRVGTQYIAIHCVRKPHGKHSFNPFGALTQCIASYWCPVNVFNKFFYSLLYTYQLLRICRAWADSGEAERWKVKSERWKVAFRFPIDLKRMTKAHKDSQSVFYQRNTLLLSCCKRFWIRKRIKRNLLTCEHHPG